jgi:hypothetical protein
MDYVTINHNKFITSVHKQRLITCYSRYTGMGMRLWGREKVGQWGLGFACLGARLHGAHENVDAHKAARLGDTQEQRRCKEGREEAEDVEDPHVVVALLAQLGVVAVVRGGADGAGVALQLAVGGYVTYGVNTRIGIILCQLEKQQGMVTARMTGQLCGIEYRISIITRRNAYSKSYTLNYDLIFSVRVLNIRRS